MAATVMSGLLPETQGMQFSSRPALRTRDGPRMKTAGQSSSQGPHDSTLQTPNASLSSIEVEALLREKVRAKHSNIMQAFHTYDIEQNHGVTKGEFRRVIESFCSPLTTEQFEAVLAKVDKNPNGTVKYLDFMDKFYGQNFRTSSGSEKWRGMPKFVPPGSAREINIDMVEKMLKEKISGNMKAVVKALQLFDYNRDGKIQRHELRRVLENYCFKLSDQQYEKLWNRYDFHHTGVVNYKEFLARLGVSVSQNARPNVEGAKGAMLWQQKPAQSEGAASLSLKQRTNDEAAMQRMTFEQIEAEFRVRMRRNYLNLKKIFISFDRHLDGFIDLEDLKSILIHFTIPMSDQLFTQLMEKCGIRGTGKISWESFLSKFQDPQSGGNGQTLPIKPSHKFFPIKEELHSMEVDDIWKLLYKHVHSHYKSIRDAFLQFDINRKGRVSRKELREVIEKFTFRLSDQQFKQLMLKLDPYHTNNISYQQFLALFEERDTWEGHKWLNSVHRFNENPKPAILAWETVEEILREKISENWKSVADAIVRYDHAGDGYITQQQMKKVLDNYALLTSDEHFRAMLEKCLDCSNGRVNYVEFMEKLGVDVCPGDIQGLSTQIMEGSHERENIRVGDQVIRQLRNVQRAKTKTEGMSAEEVIARLRDRMNQHKTQIRQAFLSFDKLGKGQVYKRTFREVLAGMGLIMSDDQFVILTTRLGFKNGRMTYPDFVAVFDDPRIQGPMDAVQRSGNHHVNPIRGDEYGMTADEVEKKMISKLRENFSNLREAFYKFDEDHNGILTKENFRRLLDSFMCIMSDNEFNVLCKRMGIDKKTKVSYEDFLKRFQLRDTAEGHKWLKSVHRFNETLPVRELSAEEVHMELKRKAHQQWKDIAAAFISIDGKGKGVVTKRDLRDLLFRFVLPMGPEEFQKLWDGYDTDKKGYLSHKDFLKKLGATEFTPTDTLGISSTIIDDSRRYLQDHNKQQLAAHQRITQHQAERVAFMSAEDVERQLRDKIRDKYTDFYTAFRKYDKGQKGCLSVKEIQQVLTDFSLFMNDEQFFRLLDRIGLRTNRSTINYDEFLKAFEDGRKSAFGQRERDIQFDEFTGLSPAEAETRIHQMAADQYDTLLRAFASFDRQQVNAVPLADFRRILDIFLFRLTDPQWKQLLSKLQVKNNMISYMMFLDSNGMNENEDADRWIANIQRNIRAQTPQMMTMDDLQQNLREAVTSHFYSLARAFSDVDYAGIGVVSKEDFRDVIAKNAFRMSDEQFETLLSMLPTNDFGNIDYKMFLNKFSLDPEQLDQVPDLMPQRPASTLFGKRPDSRALSRAMSRSLTQLDMRRSVTRNSRARSRMATPMINAESAEKLLKDAIFKNWKEIQRQCRNCDKSNTGTIPVDNILEIFDRLGVNLPQHDLNDLLTKYDLKENDTFAYVDFLRHFMINLKPSDDASNSSLLMRKKIPQTKVTNDVGPASQFLYDAMMRVGECVIQNWKEMRRNFRSADPNNSGFIDSLEFRRILRQFNVNLSEEEFYHVLSFYDKNMNGSINYNDFIRAYLQQP